MRNRRDVSGYRGKGMSIWLKLFIGLLLAGILGFGALFGAVMYGAYDHISDDPQVMIVLGCQVKPWGPSILLQDRLDKALDYLEDHPDMLVVVSGGQGPNEPTTEAQAMAEYLCANGVAEENIIQETMSHNTSENLRYSMKHLVEDDVDLSGGVIIVSNGFHLTRARLLANRVGFENVSTLAAPSSHLPSRLRMYIREPLALVKSFVFDW